MKHDAALERAMATVPAGALRTINALDGLSEFTGKAVSWLYIPMVAALVFEVVMRYAFHAPTIWSMAVAALSADCACANLAFTSGASRIAKVSPTFT